ncbi:MAG: hypothetical protein ACREPS_02985, partial [Rhodanobacteraceae bacterium]
MKPHLARILAIPHDPVGEETNPRGEQNHHAHRHQDHPAERRQRVGQQLSDFRNVPWGMAHQQAEAVYRDAEDHQGQR